MVFEWESLGPEYPKVFALSLQLFHTVEVKATLKYLTVTLNVLIMKTLFLRLQKEQRRSVPFVVPLKVQWFWTRFSHHLSLCTQQ